MSRDGSRDDALRVCRAILAPFALDELWDDCGPTPRALSVLDDLPRSCRRTALLIAWLVWDGSGRDELARLLAEYGDASPLARLRQLVQNE